MHSLPALLLAVAGLIAIPGAAASTAGEETAAVAKPQHAQDPLAPLPPRDWDRDAARHLLDRAGFGGTPEEIDAVFRLGLDGAVDALLAGSGPFGASPATPAASEVPAGIDRDLAFDAVAIVAPGREARREMADASDDERKAMRKERRRDDRAQADAYRAWWLERMANGRDPLREKMALYWHGTFTSAQREVRDSYAMARQIELYRSTGLGSFRDLLHAASKEPAMLAYLDADKNRKGSPNENFAREVMELFVLGAGNYGEQDIHEAARAFTGWTHRNGEFRFARTRHDRGEKTILGRTGRFDGDDVLDLLLEQEAAAPYVTRRIVAFFALPDPDEALVAALAARLRAAEWDLRALLRDLFRSRAFYAREARCAQFKSPVEFVVSTVRRLGIEPPEGTYLAEACERLGQALLDPPTVKGWDGGEAWISTSTILERANVARVLVHGLEGGARARGAPPGATGEPSMLDDLRGTAGERTFRRSLRSLRGWRPDFDVAAFVAGTRTSREAVLALCDRFLPVAPLESTVDELRAYVAPYGDDAFSPQDVEHRERLRDAVHLVLCLPEYQLN